MFTLYKLRFSNGKVYIGQTTRALKLRVSQHRQAMRAGSDLPVHCAWRVLGEPVVSALSTHEGQEQLHAAEIAAIFAFSSIVPGGYNLGFGGETAPSKTPAVAAKIAEKARGRSHSPEVLLRIAETSKAHWADPEYRAKVTEAVRASMTPELHARLSDRSKADAVKRKAAGWTMPKGAMHGNFGRAFSEETRAKMSAAAKGKPKAPRSPETRAKFSANAAASWADPEIRARRSAAIKAAKAKKKEPE